MNDELKFQLLKLPPAERLHLAGDLWDSLSDDDIKLTASQRTFLRRRLEECRADRKNLMTLDEFRKKIREGKRRLQKNRRKSA